MLPTLPIIVFTLAVSKLPSAPPSRAAIASNLVFMSFVSSYVPSVAICTAAGKIDFLDVNSAYIDSLKAINENNFNKLFEAESCVLESFHYKKGNKKQYERMHTQRCLYLLNQSNRFNMSDLNEKYEYDEEFGKKMSIYERNKKNKL